MREVSIKLFENSLWKYLTSLILIAAYGIHSVERILVKVQAIGFALHFLRLKILHGQVF